MDRVEWISMMHKQNLNGRETEDELFEAGIRAGIEVTEEFMIEFTEWMSGAISSNYKSQGNWFVKGQIMTSLELLKVFKRERSETVA
jgi:hypothetical protein